jgi:hypothetical protein
MLAEYQKKSNYGIAIGILLQIASIPFSENILGFLLLVAGMLLLLYGCCCYAMGKGYHGILGGLGILSLLGLIILVLLPDKHK